MSLLTPEAVTELSIVSMENVPFSQPKMFGNSYTPIAAAGTVTQVSGCGIGYNVMWGLRVGGDGKDG